MAGGELLLEPGEAEIARRLRAVAQQYSLGPETPVVDLTGVGAGYAFVLGGRPLGRAHFYGTWEGRVDSARYALERVPCEDRAAAWLLRFPDNPSDVSPAFTDGRLDLAADYDVVTTVVSHQYGRTFALRPPPALLGSRNAGVSALTRSGVAVGPGELLSHGSGVRARGGTPRSGRRQ